MDQFAGNNLLGKNTFRQVSKVTASTDSPNTLISFLPMNINTNRILAALIQEREQLDSAIAALQGIGGTGKRGRGRPRAGRQGMSAAGRARIAAAQRKRWAKVRAKKKSA
jgi:hypothetical protein